MGFLLAILCIWVFFKYLFPPLLHWFARRQLRKFAQRVNNKFAQGGQAQEEHTNEATRTRKKIDPSVGEYVAFEEIPDNKSANTDSTQSSSASDYTSDKRNKTKPESQIVDAEWEDI